MNKTWQTFLESTGAIIENGCVIHYGSPLREQQMAISGDTLCDLSHLGDLTVSGDDAATFLQGQLSNDIQLLDGRWQWSGHCNPQGRLLALFQIFRSGENHHLLLPGELLATIKQRLQMFVLRSKVTLEDNSDELLRIGVAGPDVEKRLAEKITNLPAAPGDMTEDNGLCLLRLPGKQPRFLLSGSIERIKPLWQALDVHAAPVGNQPWLYLDIAAGHPRIVPASAGMFVPQMLNLRELDAINFDKGCYTGQEIVARLQYRGTLKRRMYRIQVNEGECPDAGNSIHVCGESPAIGNVVSAVSSPDGGFAALAVITVEHIDKPLCLGNENGPGIEIATLPYDFAPLSRE